MQVVHICLFYSKLLPWIQTPSLLQDIPQFLNAFLVFTQYLPSDNQLDKSVLNLWLGSYFGTDLQWVSLDSGPLPIFFKNDLTSV